MLRVILVGYFLVMNILSFSLMGIDKSRARRRAWRISERTLFAFALLGGSAGSVLGMHVFHHKTKHWYFVWGMPLIFLIQAALAVVLWYMKVSTGALW